MRIPTSMIVMGLITAVPFGLAIKQTLSKSSQQDRELEDQMDPDAKYERQAKEYQEKYERERAEEAAAEKTRKEAARAKQKLVFGPQPATLGPLFGGVHLGTARDDMALSELNRKLLAEDSLTVEMQNDLKTLAAVKIKIGGYGDDCGSFSADLDTAWGTATETYGFLENWAGPDGATAKFDSRQCTLSIQHTVDADKWIAHGDASLVPIDYVGKNAAILKAKLGENVDQDETMAQWFALGVGQSEGVTNVTATIEGGKITAIGASVTVSHPTKDKIVDRLTKLFGKPVEYPDSGAELAWKGHPHVEITMSGTLLELRATK